MIKRPVVTGIEQKEVLAYNIELVKHDCAKKGFWGCKTNLPMGSVTGSQSL